MERRALRTVVVPAALKGTAKRTPKGLVVTSMLVGEEVAKKMAAEARAEAAEARMEDDVGTA